MKTCPASHTLLALSVVLAVCRGPLTAEDKADPTTGKTKAKVRVDKTFEKSSARLDTSGKLIVEYTVSVPVFVQQVKVVNGKEIKVTVVRSVLETRARILAKGTYRVFNSTGDPIKAEALTKLLKDKRAVYIAPDKLPDAEQLKRLDKDAVIVVEKRRNPQTAKP